MEKRWVWMGQFELIETKKASNLLIGSSWCSVVKGGVVRLVHLESSNSVGVVENHPAIDFDSPGAVLGFLGIEWAEAAWWSEGAREDDLGRDLSDSAVRIWTLPVANQLGLEMRKSRVEEVQHWSHSVSGVLRIFVDHFDAIPTFWSLEEHGDELGLHVGSHLGCWA